LDIVACVLLQSLSVAKSPFTTSSSPNSFVLWINPCSLTNVASEPLVKVNCSAIVSKSKLNVGNSGAGAVSNSNSVSVNASFQTANALFFP